MRARSGQRRRMMNRNIRTGLFFLGAVVILAGASALLSRKADAAAVMAPRFEVDPLWPKPLPNHWLMGQTIGVSVDAQDNVWIIHRGGSLEPGEQHAAANPPISQCCKAAPPILEFDKAGNLLNSWGGPGQGYDWPDSNHGITIDYKGNVWIGGNGRGPQGGAKPGELIEDQVAGVKGRFNDNMVLKFTATG